MLPKDLAAIIEDCLRRGKRIYQGKILGAANTGGRVTVELDVPSAEVGRVVGAIAGNDCLGGRCTVLQANDGAWYVLSSSVQQEPVSKQIVGHRRRRKVNVVPVEVYPFKILFSVIEDGIRKFFVGGDRPTPLHIHDDSIYAFGAGFNNTGKRKQDFVTGIKFISILSTSNYGYGISTIYADNVDNWTLDTLQTGYINWSNYAFWQSSIITPTFTEIAQPPILSGNMVFSSYYNSFRLSPSPPSHKGAYQTNFSSDEKVWPGAVPGYPSGDQAPWTVRTFGFILYFPQDNEAVNSSGAIERPRSWKFDGAPPLNSTATHFEKESRNEGFDVARTPDVVVNFPGCNASNDGQVIQTTTPLPLYYRDERIEKNVVKQGTPKMFSAFDKVINVENGNYSYSLNDLFKLEYKQTLNEITMPYRCTGFVTGVFYDRNWYEWDWNSQIYSQKISWFNQQTREETKSLTETGSTTILPGIHLPYERSEIRTINSLDRAETIEFTGSDNPATNPTIHQEVYQETKTSMVPECMFVSNKLNLAIYSQTTSNYNHSSNNSFTGWFYDVRFGFLGYDYGSEISDPGGTQTIEEGGTHERSCYLYDKKTGQSQVIKDTYVFSIFLGIHVNIKLGTLTVTPKPPEEYLIASDDSIVINKITTITVKDTLQISNNIPSSSLPTVVYDIPNRTEIRTHVQRVYINSTSHIKTNVYTRKEDTFTKPNPFWDTLIGTNIVLSQLIDPQEDKAIQGHGVVTAYTFEDVEKAQGNYDDVPKNRQLTSLTINIEKVIPITYDPGVGYEAMIYSCDSIFQFSGPNVTFLENPDSSSPIKGTIYNPLLTVDDYKVKDAIGYVVAYDITEVQGQSILKCIRRPELLKGKIRSLKLDANTVNANSYQIWSESFYPSR